MVVNVEKLLRNEEQLRMFIDRATEDTGFVAREIMGFNYDIDWTDKRGQRRCNEGTGGLRDSGPHAEFTAFLDNEEPFSVVLMPRGTLKSSGLEARSVRAIIRDPNVHILYMMKTDKQAKKKSLAIRRQFESNPILRDVFRIGPGDHWEYNAWTVSAATDYAADNPTFQVASVKSPPTGGHPDLILFDDLCDWESVRTPEQMETAQMAINMAVPLRNPGGKLIDVGTPYHPADVHAYCVKMGWKLFHRGAGYEPFTNDAGELDLRGTGLFPNLPKEFLLEQLRKGMPLADWTSQYLCQYSSSSHAVFRREWFRTSAWSSEMSQLSGWLLVDAATSVKKKSALTALIYVGIDQNRRIFLLDGLIGRMEPTKTIEGMFSLINKWRERVNHRGVTMENIALHEMLRGAVDNECRRRGDRIVIREIPRGTAEQSKEQRIRRLEPVLRSGNFVVVDTFPRTYHDGAKNRVLWEPAGHYDPDTGVRLPDGELVTQFVEFPAYPYRDIPDVLADVEHVFKNGERAVYFAQPRQRVEVATRAVRTWTQKVQGSLDVQTGPRQDWMDRLGPVPS